MTYVECSEIASNNKHYVGSFLDENLELTKEDESKKHEIIDVVVAPPDKGINVFWNRYKETEDFEEAINQFRSYQNLEVNFYALNLETGEFGFLPFKNL